jgi:aminoglycoside phosphotransferase (APT) family kinase protein
VRTPVAEHAIDASLVRDLLVDQHPDLAALPLAPFSEGWDNALWQLGDDLLVRLPRRAMADPLVVAEQRWLPEFARRLPLPIPAPVRVGLPGRGYPWHWSVTPLLAGSPASLAPPIERTDTARMLGQFLCALHTESPPDAPHNAYRGVPLAERAQFIEDRATELVDEAVAKHAVRAFGDAVGAPPFEGPRRWIHGDLHPGNVLVDSGELVGVIDFGDLTGGDPATDLAGCWLLFGHHGLVEAALDAYGAADDALVARARGWAIAFSVMLATIEDDTTGLKETGQSSLERLLEGGG